MTDETPARRWRSPAFITCVVITVLCGFGLDPAMTALQEHYRKAPAPIRKPLADLSLESLPAFRPAPASSPFQMWEDAEEIAGTSQWTTVRLQDRDARGIGGQSLLFVTYYNDPDDLVPHTPEVCYRQGRAVVRDLRTLGVDLRDAGADSTHIPLKSVLIEQGSNNVVVVYAFCVNGEFTTDRLAVRLAMQLPGLKRVYFSKIEAVSAIDAGESRAEAERRCTKLLAGAIPILQSEHFPRTEDLARR